MPPEPIMTDVSEAEVETAAKTIDPDAWDNAKTVAWSHHMIGLRQRNARDEARAALSAAAQVREAVTKFATINPNGSVTFSATPFTEPDSGPSVLGISKGKQP